jgi:hypothetical protein
MYILRAIVLSLFVITATGCESLTPIASAFSAVNIAKEVIKAENPPPAKVTAVGEQPSLVVGDAETLPLPNITFDEEKALNSIPAWLILIVIVSGILTLINSIRHHYNNKKEVYHDSSGIDNDGGRSSDGRFVQVHGECTEEQTSSDGNADERPSTEGGHPQRRPRVIIQVGRRSS